MKKKKQSKKMVFQPETITVYIRVPIKVTYLEDRLVYGLDQEDLDLAVKKLHKRGRL